ncbi:MAG TPA: outer membrane protein assembly factor BamD [Gammaproteobacteria bacterium]|nr:outer membrane protein assembly factor BamD [Gammaproteobacteria bacterium]HQZ87162.1 outer membrane protein assembly factor BamD [Gammaproteobacteria bacterium]HRA42364.1 outer membrane protein assembly factor BamD [Gammaproteobacteria bacterium]
MLKNLGIIITVSAALLLVGCQSKDKDNYKGMSASEIYAQAEKNVAKEKFPAAAKDFEALEARFPYGEYSDKAQLGLINAYYKQNEPALAISAADRFIRMNPHHPCVDYAYYLKGLVTFEQNYSFTFRYLPLDKSARDPSTATASFDAFKELIDRFPNSKYAPDARQRMVFLKNQLANHELSVLKYYVKRGAWLSATNRANYIVKHFEKTSVIPEALAIMVTCYRQLGMQQLANDVLKTLRTNFPDCKELQELN